VRCGAGLVLWAAGRCSEDHISTIYVTLGNDFNKACAAFAKEEIHMTCVEFERERTARELTDGRPSQ
jgi:hypothetical protein